MGGFRGQNEQSACLIWYQPLEALKPVERLPSFSVHGKVSDDKAGEEKQHLTRSMFPPFSSFSCPLPHVSEDITSAHHMFRKKKTC